jgi:hypothetical protein
MVLLIASWGALRVPIALGLIDPQCRRPQNSLFRQMLAPFVPQCGYGMQATSVSNNYSFIIAEKEVLFVSISQPSVLNSMGFAPFSYMQPSLTLFLL